LYKYSNVIILEKEEIFP